MSIADMNPPQRAAVRYLDGPLLVLAGAGSGKTRVITQKIAYLVREGGMSACNIAAITFTNKAAREMLERVGKLLPADASRGLTVSTFHSLGLQILRQEAPRVGYKPQFSILDSADAAKIISDLLATTSKDEIRRVQSQISRWKNDLLAPESALVGAGNEFERIAARIYLNYQDTLLAYQAMDFDDLIRLPVRLFETDREALEKWQAKLRYLLIDEYQDTNTCQYLLVKLLAGVRGMFTAVGDDLRLARRQCRESGATAARLSAPARDQAGAELPFDRPHPACGQQRDFQQSEAVREAAVERTRAR